MKIAHDSLVLVADGRKMLFFRNEGGADDPRLAVEEVKEQDNPANGEHTTDAPGRTFSSVGQGRSSFEETDFHQQQEDRFAGEAAAILRTRALANEYEALLIVAPPQTLGELRKHYHKAVKERLVGEIAKDLTGHPVDQIAAIIQAN